MTQAPGPPPPLLTGEVNNTDYLVILALVSGWDIFMKAGHESEHFVLRNMLQSGKIGKHKDLSHSDKVQIVIARGLGQSIYNCQCCGVFLVCSGQYLLKVVNGSKKGERGQVSLIHVGSEGWPVWANLTDKLL